MSLKEARKQLDGPIQPQGDRVTAERVLLTSPQGKSRPNVSLPQATLFPFFPLRGLLHHYPMRHFFLKRVDLIGSGGAVAVPRSSRP